MASIDDQDRFFSGQLQATSPNYLLNEGEVARVANGRFVEGAITNAIGFEKLDVSFADPEERIFTSPLYYQDLLKRGDVQLVAPLENIAGKFLIVVISGFIFSIDVETGVATDITPADVYVPDPYSKDAYDSFIPDTSRQSPLSYLDNDGGVYGVGGYLVIFNYPNNNIFVTPFEVRSANPEDPVFESPPARMGATAGRRLFTIFGDNLMYASDPLGGASSQAPLTFAETLDPNASYTGQIFTIGSALDIQKVTATCRLPRYLGPSQEFLAQNLLVSTEKFKYIISAGTPRSDWETTQFISYAGSADGIAGPLACTNIGDVLIYVSTTGRIKSLSQDQERDTGLSEGFLDDSLGQYLCHCESNFHHRDWYRALDHSRSIVKFNRDRLYVTVYPMDVPAVDKYGKSILSPSHRALAVGSIDSTTRLGPTAKIAWEGFYDWINPIGVVTIGNDLYVVSKGEYGEINYYKERFGSLDDHPTTIHTRAYFKDVAGKGKSICAGSLYFRVLAGQPKITISYLLNNEWVVGTQCIATSNLFNFAFHAERSKTDAWGIPLKIEIDHQGCRFELETIRVEGETHRESRRR